MPTVTLTDLARDLWVESLSLGSADLLGQDGAPWSVTKRALRGGRRDGVDLIHLNNGDLSVAIVPTRGMGLWKGKYHADRLGWDSPIHDGPVHPAFVNLASLGGIGWIDGFDEMVVRCGLAHNGAPYREGDTIYPLHGSIANIPAHYVALHVEDTPPHAITIEGHVDESRLFGPTLRMVTRITTTPGSNRLVVRDEFTNRGDGPTDLEILYHCNFGPPHLEKGASFVAAAETVVPRNARAAEGIASYTEYGPPEPGFAEQVYLFELRGQGADGQTATMLRNAGGNKAIVIRFDKAQLPCFTLWKNTGGRRDGYVTGMEPATNFPNPKPFEKDHGRVLSLKPGASHTTELTFEFLDNADAVARVEKEIQELQSQAPPTIHQQPVEPFASPG